MTRQKLSHNPALCEVYVCQLSPVSIGDESVGLSCSTRILGCVLDSNMTFKEHIVDIAKSCVFKLRNMYNVGRCITIDAAKVMVHTMIISKRHPLWPTFNKSSYLQSVQNTAARFITKPGSTTTLNLF